MKSSPTKFVVMRTAQNRGARIGLFNRRGRMFRKLSSRAAACEASSCKVMRALIPCMPTPLMLLALYWVDLASISSSHSRHSKLRKLVKSEREGERSVDQHRWTVIDTTSCGSRCAVCLVNLRWRWRLADGAASSDLVKFCNT